MTDAQADPEPEFVTAPFTADQVASLNGFQRSGCWHDFTCGADNCRETLVATESGWICPASACTYTQDWAWPFMADWSWRAQQELIARISSEPPR